MEKNVRLDEKFKDFMDEFLKVYPNFLFIASMDSPKEGIETVKGGRIHLDMGMSMYATKPKLEEFIEEKEKDPDAYDMGVLYEMIEKFVEAKYGKDGADNFFQAIFMLRSQNMEGVKFEFKKTPSQKWSRIEGTESKK